MKSPSVAESKHRCHPLAITWVNRFLASINLLDEFRALFGNGLGLMEGIMGLPKQKWCKRFCVTSASCDFEAKLLMLLPVARGYVEGDKKAAL